jgi:hypothetical protein
MRRHHPDRASPVAFDFTAEEWAATHELLVKAKAALSEGARMISIQAVSLPDWFGHKAVRVALDNFSMRAVRPAW